MNWEVTLSKWHVRVEGVTFTASQGSNAALPCPGCHLFTSHMHGDSHSFWWQCRDGTTQLTLASSTSPAGCWLHGKAAWLDPKLLQVVSRLLWSPALLLGGWDAGLRSHAESDNESIWMIMNHWAYPTLLGSEWLKPWGSTILLVSPNISRSDMSREQSHWIRKCYPDSPFSG